MAGAVGTKDVDRVAQPAPMRILLLTQWFDPEPAFKGLAFARALVRRGHEVEVLTGFPNYPGGRLYPGYRVRPVQRELIEGIPVTRVALYPSHDGSAIRRVCNYLSFACAAATMGVYAVRRPEVVYVYHPPATIAVPALMLKALRGVPYVLDVLDLWPDTLAATGMVADTWILRAVGAFCRISYRSAARIVVPTPGFRELLIERGVPAEKIALVYNWSHEPQDCQARPDAPIVKEAGIEGRFNVVFAGNMGRAQALSSVLSSARLVAGRAPQVQFVFVGGGIDVEALKAEAERKALPNVRFLPARSAAEVGALLVAADLLLVHLRDAPLFRITIPSKTQAYMAAARPILMAVRGDAARLVEAAGAGVCVAPEDPEALANAVCELSATNPERLSTMGRRGRAYYLREMSLETGTTRFEAVFRQVARQGV